MSDLIKFVMENYGSMLTALMAIVVAAELITRFTPTKKDDAFVERVGAILKKIMDFLKVPNNSK